jgi:prophage tail gpP-like protein
LSITFEQESAKQYGTPIYAPILRQANPDRSGDNVGAGQLIKPTLPSAPADKPHELPADNVDEVALLIDGQRYRYWSDMVINRALDSIDTLDIRAPFDSAIPEFKKTFQPFSYKDMAVTIGGQPLFTGTMVSVNPNVTDTEKTVTVSGYAKCGVLNDVNPPASALPLEFNNQNLKNIAAKLCEPFGVSVDFKVDPGATFERVACDPGRKILEFLTELAQQRGLVISSNPAGGLVFSKPQDSEPVARVKQGESPVTAITARFSPQDYFSHITGLESAEAGKKGGQHTVKNPHVKAGVRPFNFSVTDADGPGVKQATEAKAGRMIGNMASYSVSMTTWRDPQGNLWEPGKMLTLTAPDALIYNDYTFMIRAVALSRDADSMTATLELSMAGAFSGKIPETLPWDE